MRGGGGAEPEPELHIVLVVAENGKITRLVTVFDR